MLALQLSTQLRLASRRASPLEPNRSNDDVTPIALTADYCV
jgi:hypothetical protein